MHTGVYLCYLNRDSGVGYSAIAKYAANLPGVEAVRLLGHNPPLDPLKIAEDVKRSGFNRIVVGGDTPGYFRPAFTRAMVLAGRDPDEVKLASFSAHGAHTADDTERAESILACAVHGVPFPLAAIPDSTPMHPATLIIGGGVAGIQAALEIADAGKKVYLVERSPTIGGHMAMFDKTFPTLDCAACILTPKMVAVGQHDMITLLVNSEVQQVSGQPGAYKVDVLRRAGRVDASACVSCGVCADYCPISVSSEFDSALSKRKAIYLPFPQAVPNTFVIDPVACTWVVSNGKKCGACAKKCPKDCIKLNEEDETIGLEVGNIVLATGYELLDAARIDRYGYGVYPNVLTSLEFERLTNASGPTGGKIVKKSKRLNKRTKQDEWVTDPSGELPNSVAIIHCVGSRDEKYNPYCSRVCCMYSLKFAHLVKEKLPGARCYEFYIDMRAFGKGYEEFAERIQREGTFMVRGRTAKVFDKDNQLMIRGEDILNGKLLEFSVDMVILAVGLVPAQGTRDIADMLGLKLGKDGWFSELDYNADPTDTERGGVYVAGMCQGPKDIPDSVAQASAVAAGVLKSVSRGRGVKHLTTLSLSDIEARAQKLASI